jgi:hypothetical protein
VSNGTPAHLQKSSKQNTPCFFSDPQHTLNKQVSKDKAAQKLKQSLHSKGNFQRDDLEIDDDYGERMTNCQFEALKQLNMA